MSRHTLDSRTDRDYSVTVGWDSPLGTFFGQVIAPDGELLVDVGEQLDRVLNPGQVLDAVRPYASIPVGLDTELIRDALDDAA